MNGALATVEQIDGRMLIVRTDRGKQIAFDLNSFDGIELGYSGTIYRGQGKTLDEAYVLYTRHWSDAASYVALTRLRGDTRVFVSRDHLVKQMSRAAHRESTLGFSVGHASSAKSLENSPEAHRVVSVWETERE